MNERRGDWENSVNANLNSLNTSQLSLQQQIKELFRKQADQDDILRGNYHKSISGLVSRTERLEDDYSKLNAVVFVDSTGKHGLVADVEALKGGNSWWKEWLTFTRAIILGILTLLGIAVANWDKIEKAWNKPRKDAVGRMIENTKHPRVPRYQ